MTIVTVEFMSQVLWRQVTYTALLPDATIVGPGPYGVLYQLHGGGQRHTTWLYASKLVHYIQDLPFIVIMPDGAQSRWANDGKPFNAYEDFLMEELAQHVRHIFPATSGKWAIGGNSMGGFGAVRLGLKYPARFYSIWSHSGVFPTAATIPEHWSWHGSADALDCYALVEQLDPQTMPRLTFDCGTEDHLLDSNRRFHAFLEARGIPHIYHEHPGGHTWDYWDSHVQEALRQHQDLFPRLQ
ncbi:MAG: alpha/beta hydrolase-fold protein [Caldilineaceae bacterium]